MQTDTASLDPDNEQINFIRLLLPRWDYSVYAADLFRSSVPFLGSCWACWEEDLKIEGPQRWELGFRLLDC